MPIRERNEDLFEESRMSFGEHIEELRRCLIRAMYGLGIAMIIGFLYAEEVVTFLQRPLEIAIQEFGQKQAKIDLEKRYGFFDPEYDYWIKNQEMAPKTVLISPSQVANIGGQDYDEDEGLMRGFEIVSGEQGSIAKRLLGKDDSATSEIQTHAQALFKLLDQSEQTTIKTIAAKTKFNNEDSQAIQAMLDRVAAESRLHQNDSFDDLTIEQPKGLFAWVFSDGEINPFPAIRERIEKENDQVLAVILNRSLIHHTFEDKVTPPRANLVEVQLWFPVKAETQSLTPHEAFMIWMKAGFFASLILASPWIFYQLWLFVASGLYPHEKRYVHWYLPISIVLFFSGISLAFFFVMTPVLNFLFQFNQSMGISPQLRINYWLSFVMYLPVGFGIAFQLPLVMLLLNRLGILDIQTYKSKWRIAIMVIFVLSMFLTPADPMSMIMLAVPLSFLYFFGIMLCKWMPRNQNPFGEIHEPA